MGSEDMGRVQIEATIYNVKDLYQAQLGALPAERVRKITVTDALVDTGATTLCLPKRLITELGLTKQYDKRAATAVGVQTLSVYEAARVEIMGRLATADPIELSDESPVLIGQIQLEMMDWVVDVKGKKLIGNPAHGGEHVLEVL